MPALEAAGFAFVTDKSIGQDSWEFRAAFPLGFARRPRDGRLDCIDVQLGTYDRDAFVLNLGVIPPEGIAYETASGPQTLPQARCIASDAPRACHLRPYRLFPVWFGFHFWEGRSAERVVRHAVGMLPEVEAWFDSGRPGPHMTPMRTA